MVEEAVKSYRVAYERDESGWWVATVRGVRGCHTHLGGHPKAAINGQLKTGHFE